MSSLPSGLAMVLAGALLVGSPLLSRAHTSPAPTASAATGSATSPAAARPGYVVAALGDSLTDPRVGGGRYLKSLARACPGGRFDAYGVGGQQTRHLLGRVQQDLFGVGLRKAPPKPKYTHTVVLGGINDVLGAQNHVPDVKGIETNLASLYRIARERGVKVVALTLPPWGWSRAPAAQMQATDTVNAWILARQAAGDVDHVVDIRPALSCGDPRALCREYRYQPGDHVHWNERGHQAVAALLKREVFAGCP